MQRAMRNRRNLAGLVVLVGALGFGRPFMAQEQELTALEARHRAEVALRYRMEAWPRGEARAGLPIALELRGWRAGELESDGGRLTRTFTRSAAAEAAPSFVLETHVADSAAQAHDDLLLWLAGLQSPERMPSATDLGLALGDVGFAGRSGAGLRTLAWVAFVRGNVAVRLTAFDAPREPELDLAALALELDSAVRRVPALKAGARPATPRIESAGLARTELVAGERLRLDVSVVDAAGTPHVAWVVGGTAHGYVERAADGGYELFTTAPGEMILALEVTGALGSFTRREFSLSVADD